jgi:DNA phosphorothioation-associated putative methyltransferase
VSYFAYPDFEKDPHPGLVRSVKLTMRFRQLECHDFDQNGNPPILHRKESFLHPEYELYEKFARLTKQEERAGLLEETATIGTMDGWTARLGENGYALRRHRLVKARAERNGEL